MKYVELPILSSSFSKNYICKFVLLLDSFLFAVKNTWKQIERVENPKFSGVFCECPDFEFILRGHRRRKQGTNYVIQYNNLVEEFNNSVSLKETVKAAEVRPRPPEIMEANVVFHVGDRIDAYDLDGWWVDKILSKENGSGHQSVFFETTGQELDYPVLKLRVHQDWRNGKWVSSKKTKRNDVLFWASDCSDLVS